RPGHAALPDGRMSGPAPAEILRHRGAALVVDAIDGFDGETLRCRATGAGPWPWPALLEGAAQAAGPAAGLRPRGPPSRPVGPEYRDVRVHAATHAGPPRLPA